MPIYESNFFVYDNKNYDVSLNNVTSNLFQLPSGEVLVSEYSGYVYKISNTTITKAFSNSNQKGPVLVGYFKFNNDVEYFCGYHEIIIAKKGSIIKRVKINSKNDISVSFYQFKKIIYFLTNYKNGTICIRSFNGVKIETILQIAKDPLRYGNSLFATDKIYYIDYQKKHFTIYSIHNKELHFEKKYSVENETTTITLFNTPTDFSGTVLPNQVVVCKNGKLNYYDFPLKNPYVASFKENLFKLNNYNNQSVFKLQNNGLQYLFNTSFSSTYLNTISNKETNSYFVGTNTSFLRFFPYIKKYPRLFNNSNSGSVFTLLQKNNGQIWAGSYNGFLSVIDKNKVLQSTIKDYLFMNGGLAYKDKLLLFAESNKGALLFSDKDTYKKIADSTTFFYAFQSKNNILYMGSSAKGLWCTPIKNLDSNKAIKWEIVDDKKGISLFNIITIEEDKFGNIWMGRTNQGIAVYNPKTKKGKTFSTEKKEINFGAMAMFLDDKNTLWFGKGDGGLCYYDGKYTTDYDVKNFKSIEHPLLKNDLCISFIKQWKDYLILGANERILLLNLKQWYQNEKVLVRYLNAQETNFTTPTEQNSCLIDKRDESVWFSTSDMVYQWDINKWLSLPTFKVIPNILVKKDSIETEFKYNNQIDFKPSENSFDIEIKYQTKDNLPRYINGILVKKGEKPLFDNPNLQSKFHYTNLSAGDYIFFVRVCQQDGSFDIIKFPICIDNFLWQKWWFWSIISLFPIGFIIYYFKKKNEIEQTKKKLSQLNLASLSNQFRPHFMLNALNSIGSQMDGKPHAEKVISRLGESINILYSFSQSNDFVHPVINEWKLVENIIEIQKLLFIPYLEVSIQGKNLMDEGYKIPVGLFQIPVENALLHGLRNKENGVYLLTISVIEIDDCFAISIEDNGIGRKKSSTINSIKKNGNGLKTIQSMIMLINQYEKNCIQFIIEDLENNIGTRVRITIKKNINYAKIKL